MASFSPHAFYGNSSREFAESEDDFSEEENYIPPSEDEMSSTDSEFTDEDEDAAGDGNCGDAPPRGPSWRPCTRDLPDFPAVPFTVSSPGAQAHISNLHSELDYFQLFFTDELMEEIVQETNRYAWEKIANAEPLPD